MCFRVYKCVLVIHKHVLSCLLTCLILAKLLYGFVSFNKLNCTGFSHTDGIFDGTHPEMIQYQVKYYHTKSGAFITK